MRNPIVMIADDDPDVVEILSQRCRQRELAVDTATDAISALRKMEQTTPDLAIIDVNMPGGNGLAVRDMMSSNERLREVPVIILTGMSDERTIRHCHTSRAYYVPKCPDVWTRIDPLLAELLNLPSGQPTPGAKNSQDIYTGSDQEMFFDWIFDLCRGEESDSEIGYETEPTPQPWVLCIDDDSELSFGLQMRLQEYGVETLRAFEGMEGYRTAFFSTPSVILLDYHMPNGNGDYVLRRLKETPGTKDIPVIVLTGKRDRSLERNMYNLGASEFLTKPCAWDRLWPVLQKYLEPELCGHPA